jgi:uncharacterized membrane protein YcgQ (UPF0703/DUF1980 family)
MWFTRHAKNSSLKSANRLCKHILQHLCQAQRNMFKPDVQKQQQQHQHQHQHQQQQQQYLSQLIVPSLENGSGEGGSIFSIKVIK